MSNQSSEPAPLAPLRVLVGISGGIAGYKAAEIVRLLKKEGHPVHHTLLGAGVIIIEGLDLAGVPPGDYELICLPLKLKDDDGAPARVFLREL